MLLEHAEASTSTGEFDGFALRACACSSGRHHHSWLRLRSVAFVAGADLFVGRSVFIAGCALTALAIPSIAMSGMTKNMRTSPTTVAMRASRLIESSTRRSRTTSDSWSGGFRSRRNFRNVLCQRRAKRRRALWDGLHLVLFEAVDAGDGDGDAVVFGDLDELLSPEVPDGELGDLNGGPE